MAGGSAASPGRVICLVREPTPRQVEVLATYVAVGSPKRAGARLGISPRTVGAHLANMRRDRRVCTTAQLVYLLTVEGVLVVEIDAA